MSLHKPSCLIEKESSRDEFIRWLAKGSRIIFSWEKTDLKWVNGALVQRQKSIRNLCMVLRVNAKWHNKYFYPLFSSNRIDLEVLYKGFYKTELTETKRHQLPEGFVHFNWRSCEEKWLEKWSSVDRTSFANKVYGFQLLATQKVKFSIKDLFSKCDQIRSSLRIWSHLLKESWHTRKTGLRTLKGPRTQWGRRTLGGPKTLEEPRNQ